jgi:hypothetical protein
MLKSIYVDAVVENSAELPKAVKSDSPVISCEYKIDNIKVNIHDNIIDVMGDLSITTVYKAVDHTVRWNEQITPICASKIQAKLKEEFYNCECTMIKRIKGCIKQPNIYEQQVYVAFSLSDIYTD